MGNKYLLALAVGALMLVACGDDVTEVDEIHQDGMAVLEAGLELSKQKCDTENVGEMLYVRDSAEVYFCDGNAWHMLKGADGKDGEDGEKGDKGAKGDKGSKGDSGDDGTSCTAEPVKNSAGLDGIEVTCGKTVVGTIWNGKPGEDGRDGEDGDDGNDGTSCTAKSVKNKAGLEGVEVTCGGAVVDTIWNGNDGSNGNDGTSCIAEPVKNAAGLKGLEVTCGETVIDTIWNGKDGQNGNDGTSCTATVNQDGGFDLVCDGQTVGTITNGEDGVGCTLDDEGDGKVTVSCGKGSAMTTTILYKAVCGAKPYDPAKSFCSEDEVYELCGGKTYDPKKQFCDTRDNQIYGYVTIAVGDYAETWMAENLNYSVNPGEQSWCGGGEDGTKNEGDCDLYGRLYTWAAAVGRSEDECGNGKTCNLPSGDIRGVCPEGWHLPSKDEWDALITAVGGTSYAGQKLKADSDLWYEGTSNDDSFGFAVLPAGNRDDDGSFYYGGYRAYFWSSTEDGSTNANRWSFYYDYDDVGSFWDYEYYGFSVRCLRDSN